MTISNAENIDYTNTYDDLAEGEIRSDDVNCCQCGVIQSFGDVAFFSENNGLRFCSIRCAGRHFSRNWGKVDVKLSREQIEILDTLLSKYCGSKNFHRERKRNLDLEENITDVFSAFFAARSDLRKGDYCLK